MPPISRPMSTHRFGYDIANERHSQLNKHGMDTRKMLSAVARNSPEFNVGANPMSLFDPLNQGSQGACQGHALALIFAICYWRQTGRVEFFSRGGAYYLSQKRDGIRGDNGSTLSGGQWVATQHGLCLESDWPYPSEYSPRQPNGIKDRFRFKLVASQPTSDWGEVREALDMGLPVQDGIKWNSEVSRTLVTSYTGRGRGGGHSTTLWGKKGRNYRRINSWGNWDGDGCNENTPSALRQQVEYPSNTHVIYAPEGMIYPDIEPVEI